MDGPLVPASDVPRAIGSDDGSRLRLRRQAQATDFRKNLFRPQALRFLDGRLEGQMRPLRGCSAAAALWIDRVSKTMTLPEAGEPWMVAHRRRPANETGEKSEHA